MGGRVPTFFFYVQEDGQHAMDIKETYAETIGALLEPVIEAQGMELIFTECIPMKSRWIVRLYLDKPEGVTIDDCAFISDLVGDILDVHDVPPGPYTLEVSSPGPHRPIARDQDFVRFQGHRLRIKTRDPIQGRRNFSGVLLAYEGAGEEKHLRIETRGEIYVIPRSCVASAKLDEEGHF